MRVFRGILFLIVAFALVVSLLGALWWFGIESSLPLHVESEGDLEAPLRHSIESARQGREGGKSPTERQNVDWPRPDFSVLPKSFIALYLTEHGCPTYFKTPSEVGWPWLKRVLNGARSRSLQGDGRCELIFAQRLASQLGATTPSQLAVLSHQIHTVLNKDQLVAYDVHSAQFAPGLYGIEAAAAVLMKKPLRDLSLAELAELQLAIPPYDLWRDVFRCSNAPQIRIARDTLLRNLVTAGFVTEEQSKAAIAVPVRCLAIER